MASALAAPRAVQRHAAAPARALCLRARAEGEGEKPQQPPAREDRKAYGFTDDDSAGQSNIFAVEPSRYVAGSAADSSDTSGTLLIGGIAAAVAIAVAVVAITGNSQTVAVTDIFYEDAGKYESLSTYASRLRAP